MELICVLKSGKSATGSGGYLSYECFQPEWQRPACWGTLSLRQFSTLGVEPSFPGLWPRTTPKLAQSLVLAPPPKKNKHKGTGDQKKENKKIMNLGRERGGGRGGEGPTLGVEEGGPKEGVQIGWGNDCFLFSAWARTLGQTSFVGLESHLGSPRFDDSLIRIGIPTLVLEFLGSRFWDSGFRLGKKNHVSKPPPKPLFMARIHQQVRYRLEISRLSIFSLDTNCELLKKMMRWFTRFCFFPSSRDEFSGTNAFSWIFSPRHFCGTLDALQFQNHQLSISCTSKNLDGPQRSPIQILIWNFTYVFGVRDDVTSSYSSVVRMNILRPVPISVPTRSNLLPCSLFASCIADVFVSRDFSSRTFRCGRRVDLFGQHRAACAQERFLLRMHLMQRTCAGRPGLGVATKVLVHDLELNELNGLDRKIHACVNLLFVKWRNARTLVCQEM